MNQDASAVLRARATAIVRTDYRKLWHADVRSGRNGQRLDLPSTWKLDDLWRAACWQCRAEEAERFFHDAIDRGPLPDGQCGAAAEVLLRQVEYEWMKAHEIAAGLASVTGGATHAA